MINVSMVIKYCCRLACVVNLTCLTLLLFVNHVYANETINFSLNHKTGVLARVMVSSDTLSIESVMVEGNVKKCNINMPVGKYSVILPQEWSGDKLILDVVGNNRSTLYIYDWTMNTISPYYTFSECEDVLVISGMNNFFASFYAGFYSNYDLYVINLLTNKPCHVSGKCDSLPSWSNTGEHMYYTDRADDGGEEIRMFSSSSCSSNTITTVTENQPVTQLYISPDESLLLIKYLDKDLHLMLYDIRNNKFNYIKTLPGNNGIVFKLPNYPWAPDSCNIVLREINKNNKTESLVIYDVNKHNITETMELECIERLLGWDQSTNSIVFTKEDYSIWRIYPNTKEAVQVLK